MHGRVESASRCHLPRRAGSADTAFGDGTNQHGGYYNLIFDEDFVERIPGPDIGDYAGLPITDAARTRANTWDASLRRNGVPYRENSVVTEYFDRFPVPNGGEWFVVTTVVDDPTYLLRPFVTSSHFRREPDDSRWQPKPCKM